MRFAQEQWLWGVFASLVLALILVLQGLRHSKDRARFGTEAEVLSLLTAKSGVRLAVRHVLLLLAVALCFVAAAAPQYGKGTRVLPATNLDVVLVLDYSKSMYARDVSPSRIARAKVEMARMIRELSGARFGAVAFAGESISFPLTSDGAAIAQFFRGLEPNDLPVGGTAIARALESGRQLLLRDPLSKNHERVMILVTDGEDLEGDPVEVARTAAADGIRVDVVQIGGLSPEPIPDVDEAGIPRGMRTDSSGQILTTQLTPEGEAQLRSVAEVSGGQVVRAKTGDVGIEEMTRSLRKLMTEELSERVETVFADVFYYPLGLAVLLLMLEVFIGSAKKRVLSPEPPRDRKIGRRPRRLQGTVVILVLFSLGCEQVDRVFERESPVVNDAILALKEEDPDRAIKLLTAYLETGPCEAGVIGAGDRARSRAEGTYDLGLAFSAFSKTKDKGAGVDPAAALAQGQLPPGALPGQPPQPGQPQAGQPGAAPQGAADPQGTAAPQTHAVDCALRILAAISGDAAHDVAVRARSHYLAGNLQLARGEFESAVASYDLGLLLAPGVPEGKGDPIGTSLAHNRALSLRLKKEKEEQEKKEKEQNSSEEPQDGDKDQQDKEPGDKDQDSQDPGDKDQDQQDQDSQDPGDKEQDKQDQDGKEPGDKEQDKQDQDSQDPGDKEQPNGEQPEEGDDPKEQPSGKDGQDQGAPPEGEADPSKSAQSPSEARDERMLDLLEQAPSLQQHNAEQRKGQRIRGRATMEDK